MPTLMLFGGKGGVGKTTCAAARAVAAVRSGLRVLVVSTDPAHSLGDALGVRLSARRSAIAGLGGRLSAAELDAPHAFARWLAEHRGALSDVLEQGTWLDRGDIEALLNVAVPGVDELIGLIEVIRLAGRPLMAGRVSPPGDKPHKDTGVARGRRGPRSNGHGRYDLVIVDAAPTGHMLRLLAAPETVEAAAELLDDVRAEYRMIRERLAGFHRPEAADRFIALLRQEAEHVAALIRDPHRSAVHWVTLPEELALAESADALAELERRHVAMGDVIVNRVIPGGPPCPICDRLRAAERRVVARIRQQFGRNRRVRLVPDRLHEPRGVGALAQIGRELARSSAREPLAPSGASPTRAASGQRMSTSGSPRVVVNAGQPTSRTSPESIAALAGARLVFFGGKGGVGKTTLAAASALRMARAAPRRRVLLISTDPAHSLGDVFGVALDNRPATFAGAPPNLQAREVDAIAALAARRGAIQAAIEELDIGVGGEGRDVGALFDLAPPGIDELLAIMEVSQMLSAEPDRAGSTAQGVLWTADAPTSGTGGKKPARERAASSGSAGKFASATASDLIIVDTAPTGHALRLLQMPAIVREWLQILMRLLLKYRAVVRPGRLAATLVELSRSIRQLQALLRDAHQTRFVVVTRAAEVPRRETERLVRELHSLEIPVSAVVVNALTLAPGKCRRCQAIAASERRQIRLLIGLCRRARRECAIILTPLVAPPPRGLAALERLAARWYVVANHKFQGDRRKLKRGSRVESRVGRGLARRESQVDHGHTTTQFRQS